MSRFSPFLLLLLFACGGPSFDQGGVSTPDALVPETDLTTLLTDYHKWWAYHFYDVQLESAFEAFSAVGEPIPKRDFLNTLTLGNHAVVGLLSDQGRKYQLVELPPTTDLHIRNTLKNTARTIFRHHLMEGQPMPEMMVQDLGGTRFTTDSLLGRTTVLKTWFIACKPCVDEIPVLNEFVGEMKVQGHDDLRFLSLATDEAPKLRKFLAGTPFSYPTVADQQPFIQQKLKLNAYPTHLVVGPDGKILKVCRRAKDMIDFVARQVGAAAGAMEGIEERGR